MKKYLLTGGLSVVLMLGACGNEDPGASEEVEAEESIDETENESANEDSDALKELRAENESLQDKITELEEDNEEVETLQERITELEEENEALATISAEEEDTAEEEQPENDTEEEAEDVSDSTGEGTRSNPMQLGETAQLDVIINGDDYDDRYEAAAEMTINEIIIGDEAYNMLVEENQFNDPAPEGYQWALIHATFELIESETDDYSYRVMDEFKIVEGDGSSAPRESAVSPDHYGSEEIYSGGTSSGYSSLLVPEDNDFLIQYDDILYNSVFFEVN